MKPEIFANRLDAMEAKLAHAGNFPAMTPWWRDTFTRFYSGEWRQLVIRAGRRAGKSSNLCRVAVIEALYGEHEVPAGDLGICAFVSVSRGEASSKLHTARAILDALGVAHAPIENGLRLVDRPIAFRSHVATLAGVVGFTAAAIFCDELSRWRDGDGVNPATEVLASIRPAMAGTNARIFLSSSPLGASDAHALAFGEGETAYQTTAFAETWVARPGLSKTETRALAGSEREFLREYACVPQSGETAVFALEDIDAAMRPPPEGVRIAARAETVMAIDASRGRDGFTWANVRWLTEERDRTPGEMGRAPSGLEWHPHVPPSGRKVYDAMTGQPHMEWRRQDVAGNWFLAEPSGAQLYVQRCVLDIESIGELTNASNSADACAQLEEEAIRFRTRSYCGEDRVRRVLQDQYDAPPLAELLRQHGFRTHDPLVWTPKSKLIAVDRAERMMRERQVRFPKNEKLRKQLAEYSEKVTRTGSLAYSGRGNSHDDYAQVFITAVMGDVAGLLPGSPNTPSNERFEIGPPTMPDPNGRWRR